MALVTTNGIEDLRGLIGEDVGPSDWREVTQDDIDTFAALTGDDQWIHVDVERAERESPFGTTVAHGNLTLSLIDGLRRQLIRSEGLAMGVNYGWNKVRFPAPVPSGSRIRARGQVQSVDDVGGGWFQVVTRFTVQVEGSEKPACVAESVGRALPEGGGEAAGPWRDQDRFPADPRVDRAERRGGDRAHPSRQRAFEQAL